MVPQWRHEAVRSDRHSVKTLEIIKSTASCLCSPYSLMCFNCVCIHCKYVCAYECMYVCMCMIRKPFGGSLLNMAKPFLFKPSRLFICTMKTFPHAALFTSKEKKLLKKDFCHQTIHKMKTEEGGGGRCKLIDSQFTVFGAIFSAPFAIIMTIFPTFFYCLESESYFLHFCQL
jgi:hypothetical protein